MHPESDVRLPVNLKVVHNNAPFNNKHSNKEMKLINTKVNKRYGQ